MKGRGGTVGPCSYAYSWYYDQYERRRLPPRRGDHRRRPGPALDPRGEGVDRAESLDPATTTSAVARRYGLHPSRLFVWRQQLAASAARDAPGFVRNRRQRGTLRVRRRLRRRSTSKTSACRQQLLSEAA